MQVIFIITLFVLFLFFLFAPETVFQATKSAMDLWANTVVPSMLPFFILNHVLAAVGGIAMVGRLFERPVGRLLRLPGEAAFVLATGYSTGVPVSASIIADLRKKEILTKKQGEHLLAFAANVSPGFLLSAVAVAMMGNPAWGVFLCSVHYGSNLLLMTLVCLFSREQAPIGRSLPSKTKLKEVSFMEILTDAVDRGLKTIFLIGGIILSFRILISFIETLDLIGILCDVLSLSQKTEDILSAFLWGILEITTGAKSLSALPEDVLTFSLRSALLSAVFAFGGISALSQIASQIRGTDLSLAFFIKYKIIQGAMAFAISLLMSKKVPETIAWSQIAHSIPYTGNFSVFPWIWGLIPMVLSAIILRILFCDE